MVVQDEKLIRDLQDGSDLAFVTLYNRYKQAAYVYCLKMLGDVDAAKDIVQGTFLKVNERHSQLRSPERFKAWLLRIARNDCLTYLRKRRSMSALPKESEDVIFSPDCDVDRNEEIALVNRAVSRLKPKLKEVIILRQYENLSYREIADVIDEAETTVKSRLFTARQQLYELLKPMFDERR